MKLSTILAGTFAAIAAAAPAPAPEAQAEPGTSVALPVFERSKFDAGKLNNLNFKQQDLRYLFKMNNLDLNLLQVLGRQNNFNVLAFANVFNNDAFNLNALLQFQQLQTILAIAQTGVFNQFDLAGLNLAGLNLGVINGIGAFDVASIVDVAVVPQIQTVVQTITPTVIIA